MIKTKQTGSTLTIPSKLLAPIRQFLEREIVKWKKEEKVIKNADPFMDEERASHNSDENDADEQIGHFETEVKVAFIKKQLIQLRKALTKIKIGNYGLCEKCGKMIDTDRLAITPSITTCIACARDQE